MPSLRLSEMVYKYEEPFLTWASEIDWLGVMKSTIMLLGAYPNNRPGPPKVMELDSEELVETVRRKLKELGMEVTPVAVTPRL